MTKEGLVEELMKLGISSCPTRGQLMRMTKSRLEELLGYYVEKIYLEDRDRALDEQRAMDMESSR